MQNRDYLRCDRAFIRLRAAAVLAFACAALFPIIGSNATELILLTEDDPPFNMTKENTPEITGMSTELIDKLMREAGVSYKASLVSWVRAYETARTEADTCVFSTTITDDRKPLFVWVGPLFKNELVIIAKEGQKIPTSLDDLKGKTIGGYRGDHTTTYLRAMGLKVDDSTTSDAFNINKLNAGRIDYWAVGRTRFRYVKQKAGLTGFVETIQFASTELYLACNKSVAPAIIDRLNKALARYRRDGTVNGIRKKYE